MMTNIAVGIDDSVFREFLRVNKSKIDSIVPKNPCISKDDEWRKEDFWDKRKDKWISGKFGMQG